MAIKLKDIGTCNDAERLARPWQVRTMHEDNLTETFDTQEKAIEHMAYLNSKASNLGLSERWRVVNKDEA